MLFHFRKDRLNQLSVSSKWFPYQACFCFQGTYQSQQILTLLSCLLHSAQLILCHFVFILTCCCQWINCCLAYPSTDLYLLKLCPSTDAYPLMLSLSTDVYPLILSSSTVVYPLILFSSTDVYPLIISSSTDILLQFLCILLY